MMKNKVIEMMAKDWNAYTDAFVKRDNYWIKSMLRRTLIFWLFSVIACLIMLFFCDWFYTLWIGNQITVPFNVSLAVMLYIILILILRMLLSSVYSK